MADTKKIDTYFSKGISSAYEPDGITDKRAKKVRIVKLLLPALAAIILGIMVIFPQFKKTQSNIDFDITLPKKGELEKLHVENTLFNITDADNKVSQFTADNIDETEPQSKIIKLVNPKGKISLKNGGFADMHSASGFFDQANNRITLIEDAFINYNAETDIKTSRVTYDFNTHKAKGNADIYVEGIYGKMQAESFSFDTKNEVYELFGNSFLDIKREPHNILIKAKKSITLHKLLQKIVILGNASIKEADNVIYADKIDVYYEESNKKQELKDMQAFGSVKIVSPKGTVRADKGKYNPKTEFLELFGNVVIEQDENKIYGDYGTTDLKTGISKIVSTHSSSRVHGVFKKVKKLAAERKNK